MILINYQSNGTLITHVTEILDLIIMEISSQLDILKLEKNYHMIML